MASKEILKPNLEDFCIDGFFLFIEKSNHLNGQVTWETAQLRLQRETFSKLTFKHIWIPNHRPRVQLTDFIYRAFLSKVADIFVISSCSLWIEENSRKDAQLPWRQPYADTECVGCRRSHTPASSLLPDIWLPGWWSSWAEAGFPCLWLALHPQTLCTSCWTGGLRGKKPTNTYYASGHDL